MDTTAPVSTGALLLGLVAPVALLVAGYLNTRLVDALKRASAALDGAPAFAKQLLAVVLPSAVAFGVNLAHTRWGLALPARLEDVTVQGTAAVIVGVVSILLKHSQKVKEAAAGGDLFNARRDERGGF